MRIARLTWGQEVRGGGLRGAGNAHRSIDQPAVGASLTERPVKGWGESVVFGFYQARRDGRRLHESFLKRRCVLCRTADAVRCLKLSIVYFRAAR